MTRAGITRAVVAAGGAGTKMAPITQVIPKEMLPVERTPILEHLVLELRDAGIGNVLFVISSRKSQIPAYFGSGERYGLEFAYRVQDDGAGPGAPVLDAEVWTRGEQFVLAFGDNLIRPAPDRRETPVQRLLKTADPGACSVLTAVFPADQVPAHEILLGAAPAPPPDGGPVTFGEDQLDHTGARWVHACAARWVLGPFVFDALRQCPPRANGELYLIDAVRQWVSSGHQLRTVPLLPDDIRFNLDNWRAYEDAVAFFRG